MTEPLSLEQMLRQAHSHKGATAPDRPTPADTALAAERGRLLAEEVHELAEAIESGDLAHIGKEAADVIYIAAGTMTVHGLPVDATLPEVHRSNMTKAP